MSDQRVDQRARAVAGARMHNQAGRLVDDDDVGVLVKDVERDRLRPRLRFLRFRQGDRDCRPGRDACVRVVDDLAADCDLPGLDQGLQPAAGKAAGMAGEE